jgi:hypothetical protein
MFSKSIRCIRFTVLALATLLVLASAAVAGPPLIYQSFDIGDGKSLPWISKKWNLSCAEKYNNHNQEKDTIQLDGSEVPLVRMETLRR